MSAHSVRPLVPRAIRVAAVPIILAWVTMAAALNLALPQVEAVGKENAVSMSPQDAPAVIAAKEMGEKFQEFTSDSIAMVVLIGEQPLSDTTTTTPWSISSSRIANMSSTSRTSGAI
jgi:putative drug exporter of the RND superfamily